MPSGTPWSLQHAETTLPTDQTVPPRIPVTPAHTSVPPTSRRGIVVGALAVLGLAGGALDTSFGTNGIVTLDWFGVTPNVITTTDAALDSHGRLVVVGRASDTGAVHLIVGRLDTTGAFDATFATGGKFTDNAAIVQNTSDVIAIDPSNDQIYFSRNTNETGAITRLKANGDVDTSFAPATTDGQNPTEIAEQMIVQGTSLLVWRIVGSGGSVLTRLLSTGNNDATFNGKILGLPTNTVNVVSFITQNADGTLTTAGYGNNNDSLNFSYVHQMDANGNADASFGVGGTETFSYCGSSSFASTVVPQPSGPPLLIAGFTSTTVILSL